MNTIEKVKQSLTNHIKKKRYKNRAMKCLHVTLRKNFTTNGVHLSVNFSLNFLMRRMSKFRQSIFDYVV